jgi:adenylate cyclase
VVAGVIGRKKFIYDLWGATVNLASRMESHGQSGAIQITRSTYDLVGGEFDCESAGTIPVKGAGEVDMWRVVGRKGGIRSGEAEKSGLLEEPGGVACRSDLC